MTRILIAVALLGCTAVAGEDLAEPIIHTVIVRQNGTHLATEYPWPESEVRDARQIWVWTDDLPPRMLEPVSEWSRKRVLEQAHRLPIRTLQVQVRGFRKEDAEFLQLVAAPREMWISVPENLLPHFPVPPDGRVKVPFADRGRVRVVGKVPLGSAWEQIGRSVKAVEISLRSAKNAELLLESPGRVPIAPARASVLS